ncbi:MAG TPA: murein L,D-transpeptidase catalytic domain family protein [Chitinophagales bacterium]|nr:murein L,D-transpeptidase catalytic domain family protein [Chitinophagales bacterium]
MQTTKRAFYRLSVLAACFVMLAVFISATKPAEMDNVAQPVEVPGIYANLHLKQLGLSESAFNAAVKGWQKLKDKGAITKNIISICDFSQSSNNKRLYVIDLVSGTLLFNTLVAHGRNTGEEFAKVFSNQPESHKSSLGFYSTKNTYVGEHGLSLKLEGKEPGFNDKAEERAIVMHGADYVCNTFICQFGRLGRSFGCPSVPYGEHEKIINTIKNGTCLFVYYPDKKYLASSKLLR